ncbi:hypothetical protein LX69_01581 [Breznakibacter xylanolyticus]|uniref:Uncharacterized protein n=1 Tax=Breznakibacter xylanolyticus TaxID=990 RepID=A0A2W7NVD1_9BACT|nr:hypothetical protein LX69_01581 [Breznakibacter xylanolyticus]
MYAFCAHAVSHISALLLSYDATFHALLSLRFHTTSDNKSYIMK